MKRLDVSLPSACAETSPVVAADAGAAMTSRWSIRCAGGLGGETVAIDGLVGGPIRADQLGTLRNR